MLHPVFVIIFVQELYHGVRLVVKSKEEFTVIDSHANNNNNNADKFKEKFTVIEQTHTAFQEAFREDFEYSDFFRDHQLQPQHIGDVRRDYIHLWTRIGT